MTSLGTIAVNGTQNLSLWGLVNPTSGNNTIQLNGTLNNGCYVGGTSFTGTVTSSVAAAAYGYNTATGSTTSVAVTTSVSVPSGDMAVSSMITPSLDGISGFPSDGGTSLGSNGGGGPNGYAESYSGAGSTITASGTISTPLGWCAVISAIAASAGGGDVLSPQIWL